MEIIIAIVLVTWYEYRIGRVKERCVVLESKFMQLLALLEKQGIKDTSYIE